MAIFLLPQKAAEEGLGHIHIVGAGTGGGPCYQQRANQGAQPDAVGAFVQYPADQSHHWDSEIEMIGVHEITEERGAVVKGTGSPGADGPHLIDDTGYPHTGGKDHHSHEGIFPLGSVAAGQIVDPNADNEIRSKEYGNGGKQADPILRSDIGEIHGEIPVILAEEVVNNSQGNIGTGKQRQRQQKCLAQPSSSYGNVEIFQAGAAGFFP